MEKNNNQDQKFSECEPKITRKHDNTACSHQLVTTTDEEMEPADIIKAIAELKTSLTGFNDGLKHEITQLGQEINGKLDNIGTEIKSLRDRVEEVETRVEGVESWADTVTEVLATCLDREESMQQQIIDLQSRSRRNNIRVFGAGEGEEDKFNSMAEFVESLLRGKLQLPETLDLKIQRCHRSKPQRPPADMQPRSIIINFQEFTTKELVLKEAWDKTKVGKIKLNDRDLYFDHDYPIEVVKKRKAYSWIKKSLKMRGTRFQTPLTSMRIHWDTGLQTYSSAAEAGRELRRRGYNVDEAPSTGEEERSMGAHLRELLGSWQKIPKRRGGAESDATPTERERILQRARDKLQNFQRRSGDTPSPSRGSQRRRGNDKNNK